MSATRSTVEQGLPNDETAGSDSLIADRYRVQASLGEGGMARVYRVLDQRTGDNLALKQLVGAGEHMAALQAMFEREYHTLAQLAHPRIVRVFDYGLNAGSPYYTMELLDGADSRVTLSRTPLSVSEICLLLRDAASALALIHSRRMVHRDVSPRNLWCTPDGRAKLIDFGTLVAMGPQARIAGTAPFVPPEAVYMQPLDSRCDIYALGALAYFLFTKRNAYPAREINDLRQLWQRRPKKPDSLNPELPRALSELVMAMLSLDARGRPASAAEVFERLTVIAELPPEDERHLAQAFLTSPNLVGRDHASGLLRKRLLRTLRGRGATVSIVAPSGLGRSRMLGSFVLEAKLMGAATIAVDATAVGSESLALAATLAERLLEALPMSVAIAVDLGPTLGHVSPAIHRAFGQPELVAVEVAERTRKLGSALMSLFERASRQQRLVIAVDDLHRADSASLAVLGKLSLLAGEHRFLLVTTCDAGTLTKPPPALEQLVQDRSRIELHPLAPDDTRELLASLFGTVPGLDEAASWLHELSQGSPQTCMQYAQYLVDHGIARYDGGHWKLPQQLRQQGLPATLGAMFQERVAALSDDARALALGLTLARDETRSNWQPENHVHIEDFPKLLESGDSARAFVALDELLRAGMVQQRDSFYVLGQRAMIDALLRLTDTETERSAHKRLADVFEQGDYSGRLLGVRQLQRAGDDARASALMLGYIDKLASTPMDWGAMRLSVNTQCCTRALEHWRVTGGSPRDGIRLRRMLLMTCSVYDWSIATLGDEQIVQLRADSGLAHWQETDTSQADLQRVIECLKRAQAEYDKKPEPERGFAPGDALRELASCTMPLIGAFVHSHDLARANTMPGVLAPLRSLSPLIHLLADSCDTSVKRLTGREFGDEVVVSAERLLQAEGLPDVLRRGGAAINLHIQAVEDARRGRRRGLILMDRLAAAGGGDDLFLVVHGRWLGHAFRGEATLAERFRKQAEVITEDDVWRRKSFLFAEAQLHALTGDQASLARVTATVAELASAFAGWRPWLAYARAALHKLRGDFTAAERELSAALLEAGPGEHRAWIMIAPDHAELLLLQGDGAAALREAEAVLAAVKALSLDLSANVAAERVRALAESQLGDQTAARASIERAFAAARELSYDGLPLALLYATKAKVAIAAGRSEECVAALKHLRAFLDHAEAPALVNAYEALREAGNTQVDLPELPAASALTRTSPTDSTAMFTEVRTRLSAFNERQERAQQALELLLEASGGQTGHLFLFDAGGLFAAASVGPGFAEEEMLSRAQRHIEVETGGGRTEAVTMADLASAPLVVPSLAPEADSLVPMLLSDDSHGLPVFLGVALLASRETRVRTPRVELVRAISRCLQEAGDTLPQTFED